MLGTLFGREGNNNNSNNNNISNNRTNDREAVAVAHLEQRRPFQWLRGRNNNHNRNIAPGTTQQELMQVTEEDSIALQAANQQFVSAVPLAFNDYDFGGIPIQNVAIQRVSSDHGTTTAITPHANSGDPTTQASQQQRRSTIAMMDGITQDHIPVAIAATNNNNNSNPAIAASASGSRARQPRNRNRLRFKFRFRRSARQQRGGATETDADANTRRIQQLEQTPEYQRAWLERELSSEVQQLLLDIYWHQHEVQQLQLAQNASREAFENGSNNYNDSSNQQSSTNQSDLKHFLTEQTAAEHSLNELMQQERLIMEQHQSNQQEQEQQQQRQQEEEDDDSSREIEWLPPQVATSIESNDNGHYYSNESDMEQWEEIVVDEEDMDETRAQMLDEALAYFLRRQQSAMNHVEEDNRRINNNQGGKNTHEQSNNDCSPTMMRRDHSPHHHNRQTTSASPNMRNNGVSSTSSSLSPYVIDNDNSDLSSYKTLVNVDTHLPDRHQNDDLDSACEKPKTPRRLVSNDTMDSLAYSSTTATSFADRGEGSYFESFVSTDAISSRCGN